MVGYIKGLGAYNRILEVNKDIKRSAEAMKAPTAILRKGDDLQIIKKDTPASISQPSFENILEQFVKKPISQVTTANRELIKITENEESTPNLVELVAAVNNAETALTEIMVVRDRIINAYQEILRMPI